MSTAKTTAEFLAKLPAEVTPHMRSVLEYIFPAVRVMFHSLGGHHPSLAAECRYPDKIKWYDVTVMMDTKNLLEKFFIDMARRRTEFIVLVTEIWFASAHSQDDAALRELNEYCAHHSLEDRPGHGEGLMIEVMSRGLEFHAVAKIERPPNGPATLGAWKFSTTPADPHTCRRLGLSEPRFQNIWRKAGR